VHNIRLTYVRTKYDINNKIIFIARHTSHITHRYLYYSIASIKFAYLLSIEIHFFVFQIYLFKNIFKTGNIMYGQKAKKLTVTNLGSKER